MVSSNAQGFLLLTISDCSIDGPGVSQQGALSLECVTVAIPSDEVGKPADRDVWLVLRVGTFEMPISPTSPIRKSKEKHTFTFTQTDANGNTLDQNSYVLRLPPPANEHDREDLETLEVLFEQYGIVFTEGATGGEKSSAAGGGGGRLVLVDETNGQVLGTLEQNFTIREDSTVNERGREKDPVIVDLPVDDDPAAEIYVHSVKDNDPILRAAGMMSRGIMYATSAIASGMTMAADAYVARATPREKPIVFSETTKTNVRRVHNISGQAVTVTSKTVGMIHGYIDRLVDGLTGHKHPPAPPPLPHRGTPGIAGPVIGTPPPLPPRPGSKTIATSYGPGPVPVASPGPSGAYAPPPQPQKKPRLLNRLLISTDMLLTTLEHAASKLIDSGTENVSKSLGHKYGPDMGSAASMVGQSARNVGVVYIDVRGVGRRALIRRAGKKVVKGMVGGRQVAFGTEDQAAPSRPSSPLPPPGPTPGGSGSVKQ